MLLDHHQSCMVLQLLMTIQVPRLPEPLLRLQVLVLMCQLSTIKVAADDSPAINDLEAVNGALQLQMMSRC